MVDQHTHARITKSIQRAIEYGDMGNMPILPFERSELEYLFNLLNTYGEWERTYKIERSHHDMTKQELLDLLDQHKQLMDDLVVHKSAYLEQTDVAAELTGKYKLPYEASTKFNIFGKHIAIYNNPC